MWVEAYCEKEESDGSPLDPSASASRIDASPEALLEGRVPPKGTQKDRASRVAYIVGYTVNDAKDVTARYVKNLAASHAARTDGQWWEASLRAVHADRAARLRRARRRRLIRPRGPPSCRSSQPVYRGLGGGSSGKAKNGNKEAPSRESIVIDVDAEERRGCRAVTRLPTAATYSFAEYKRHPCYILLRELTTTQVLHPSDTKPVGLCKGQKVFLRSNVYRLQVEAGVASTGLGSKGGRRASQRTEQSGIAASRIKGQAAHECGRCRGRSSLARRILLLVVCTKGSVCQVADETVCTAHGL